MPDDAALVFASYFNLKPIVTRGVFQVILEIPMEKLPEFVKQFGPPNCNTWLALARLNEKPKGGEADTTRNHERPNDNIQPRSPESAPVKAGGANKKNWHEMLSSQQAGILCADKTFWLFLSKHSGVTIENEDAAVQQIYGWCDVKSRTDIGKSSYSLKQWQELVADYRVWERTLV